MSRCRHILHARIHAAPAVRIGLLSLAVVSTLFTAASPAAAQSRSDQHKYFLNSDVQSPFMIVADRVGPAVVSIATNRAGGEDNPLEDMFRQFFPRGRENDEREFEAPGAGSGFIVTADGYILTNNHVIEDAVEILVRVPGFDRGLEATLVGTDPGTDLALIKVEYEDDLPYLEFGDSDEVRVGSWAIAIGNPLGQLAGSMTVGIISAEGRSGLRIQGGTPRYQDFLQTDAAINFGNSGGPLVNIHGHVIGVNTAINAAGQNIGFAVPSNLTRNIYEQLRSSGRVVRGFLGIRMRNLNPDLSDGFDLDITRGVVVEAVLDDTPAERAGLEVGDVITEFNGERVETDRDLQFRVAEAPVGKKARLRIYRDGRERTLEVTLDEYPEDAQLASAPNPVDVRGDAWLGIEVADITDTRNRRVRDLIDTFDISEEEGVLVLAVKRGSAADRARLRAGDVIVEIVKMNIQNVEDFRRASDRFADRTKSIAILIRRGEMTSYVTVDPTEGLEEE